MFGLLRMFVVVAGYHRGFPARQRASRTFFEQQTLGKRLRETSAPFFSHTTPQSNYTTQRS